MKRKRKCPFGIVTILTITFIILELTNAVNWSWLWVFSPVWISIAAAALIFSAILTAGLVKKGRL